MKPSSKVLGGRSKVKVAVVQTPPVYLDREKTVERACQKIAEGAAEGAELISFTETWLAGYPYWTEGWASKLQQWIPVRVRFYDNALLIPSEDTDRLCDAAAKANAHVVIGCNELDSRTGVTPSTTRCFSLTARAKSSAAIARRFPLSSKEQSGETVMARISSLMTPTSAGSAA